MEFEFLFEMEDWMAFHEYHISKSKQHKRSKIIVMAILPVVMIMINFIDYLNGNFDVVKLAIFIAMCMPWLILYPKRMHKRTLKQIQKHLEEGDNSNLLGWHKYIITDKWLQLLQEDEETKIKWNKITKIVDVKNYIFLYNTSISAYIIPKKKIKHNLEELNIIVNKHTKNSINMLQ